jgi:hypothetical protein
MAATEPLAAAELAVGPAGTVTSWVQQASNPNTAGLARALGSLYLRNGAFPAQPVELYLKLAAVAKGWAKQNLVNIGPVFNVVSGYGADPTGATDSTAKIQNAINACIAAGGGDVYFPACPSGGFYQIAYGSNAAVLAIEACSNVRVVGDGYASKIRQLGTCGGHETHMFQVSNAATRIVFQDIYLDNFAITDPDPSQENHGIQLLGASTDTGNTTNIDIVRVYLGVFVGDGIRLLGDNTGPGHLVEDVRIRRCYANTLGSRSGIGVQRCNQNVICTDNYLSGKQGIHFEPTSTSEISGWTISHNLFTKSPALNDFSFDIAGEFPDNTTQIVVAHNILPLAAISILNVQEMSFVGNVAVYNPAESELPELMLLEQTVQQVVIRGNVLEHLFASGATNLATISLNIDSGVAPSNNNIRDNALSRLNNSESSVIAMTDSNGTLMQGNLCVMDSTASATSAAVQATATQSTMQDVCFVGNMVLLTGASDTEYAYLIESEETGEGAALGPCCSFFHNYASGLMAYVTALNAEEGAPPYPICSSGNMAVGTITEGMFQTTTAITCDANANGFAAQVTTLQIAAGPNSNSQASPGSICCNLDGGAYFALGYKETGVSTTTGWLGVGESDQVLGVASVGSASTALFFAPGMGLATAGGTEIQWTATRPATLRNLRGELTAGSADATNTYALRKNGATTAVTFAASNSATSGSDTTHSFTVGTGDLISGIVTKTGSPATPATNAVLSYGFA